jgi:aminoglycoside 6'-N-acetyltransferase
MGREQAIRQLEREPSAPLRGERVLLRPVRAEDGDRLEAIVREPEVARWWVGYQVDPKDLVRELLEDEDTVALAVETGGELIGLIQYEEENTPDYRHAGIDLFLATAWQGRGLGVEAVRVLARYLIEERGHHRLTIDPAVANERAVRAYERAGFRQVGVMREYERGPNGVWRDALLMDLLAREL